jgi:hypothetical protein
MPFTSTSRGPLVTDTLPDATGHCSRVANTLGADLVVCFDLIKYVDSFIDIAVRPRHRLVIDSGISCLSLIVLGSEGALPSLADLSYTVTLT